MATVVHVAGIEVLRVEVQEHAASPAKGGRPTVPVVADVRQSAQSPVIACVAEARGAPSGCFIGRLYPNLRLRLPGSCAARSCLFREAAPLKTVSAAARVAGREALRIENQIQTVEIPLAAEDQLNPW